MSFPYLDLAGVKLRSVLRPSYFDDVEAQSPGFVAQSIATNSSPINSQMRKRYGGGLPWGQLPPALVPAGLTPPAVALQGRPTLGSYQTMLQVTAAGALGAGRFQWSVTGGKTWTIDTTLASSGTTPPAVTVSGLSTLVLPTSLVIRITVPGALGTAQLQYSLDGGLSFTPNIRTAAAVPLGVSDLAAAFPSATYAADNVYTGEGVLLAATVLLGATGMTAVFPAAAYDLSNAYAADTPVPGTILRWLTSLVTEDVAIRHGVNTADPLFDRINKRVEETWRQMGEAANSKDGLWDLPASEDMGSAVNTGGPQAYSEQSPYTWTFKQATQGRQELAALQPPPSPNKLVGG